MLEGLVKLGSVEIQTSASHAGHHVVSWGSDSFSLEGFIFIPIWEMGEALWDEKTLSYVVKQRTYFQYLPFFK